VAGRLNEPEPRSHCGPVRSDFACLVQPAWSELVSRLLLIEWSQIFIKPSPSSAHWAVLDPTRDRSQLQRRAPSSSGQLQREFELVTDAFLCCFQARILQSELCQLTQLNGVCGCDIDAKEMRTRALKSVACVVSGLSCTRSAAAVGALAVDTHSSPDSMQSGLGQLEQR